MMRWISLRLWLPAIPTHEPDPVSMGMTRMACASFHTCLAVSSRETSFSPSNNWHGEAVQWNS
jgi:hypothetical protein